MADLFIPKPRRSSVPAPPMSCILVYSDRPRKDTVTATTRARSRRHSAEGGFFFGLARFLGPDWTKGVAPPTALQSQGEEHRTGTGTPSVQRVVRGQHRAMGHETRLWFASRSKGHRAEGGFLLFGLAKPVHEVPRTVCSWDLLGEREWHHPPPTAFLQYAVGHELRRFCKC